MKTAMRREFLPYDYEFFLREDIDRRLQAEKEPFSLFLASMELMFRKLSNPPTEAEKIETLRRNMHQELARQTAIYEIETVEQLSNIVKHWERCQMHVQLNLHISRPTNKQINRAFRAR
jgi:hypothetical protein